MSSARRAWLPSPVSVWSIVGAAIGVGFGAFIALFLAAELFAGPGGWRAATTFAIWLVPTLVFGCICLIRPRAGAVVAIVGAGAFLLINAASFVFSDWYIGLQNSYGPISLALGLMLWIPVCVLGLNRALLAGVILLVTIVLPSAVGVILMIAIDRSGAMVSYITLAVPFLVAGLVLLIGGLSAGRGASRGEQKGP